MIQKNTRPLWNQIIKKAAVRCSLLLSLCASPTLADSSNVPFYESKVIRQDSQKMDCGPAAIFNSFSLGNENLQSAIKNMGGGSFPQNKFQYMLDEITQKPTVHFAGENLPRTQRNPGGGTFVGDMDAILADMMLLTNNPAMDKFSGGFSYRQKGEKQGELLQRIHADLVDSLDAGYPPIFSRALYAGGMRRYGHYTMIHSVSDIQTVNGQTAFKIKIYDSIPAVTQEWLVTEVTERFEAFSWEMNRPGMKPIQVVDANDTIMSPYLKLFPEDFQASRTYEGRMLQQDSGAYIILETLFGRFQNPKLYPLGDKTKKK